jgi:uncharacterized transporter YbjL
MIVSVSSDQASLYRHPQNSEKQTTGDRITSRGIRSRLVKDGTDNRRLQNVGTKSNHEIDRSRENQVELSLAQHPDLIVKGNLVRVGSSGELVLGLRDGVPELITMTS